MTLKVTSEKLHASSLPDNWAPDVVEDWLNKTNDIVDTADAVNAQTETIESLAKENDEQQIAIESNTELARSAQSAANSALSKSNENAAAIEVIATDLGDHEALDSAHGATGNNVGTEDYCTDIIGGVALLCELVNDAVESTATITTADIALAPAAYDQAYAETMRVMANDTKAKHNTLVTDLNSAVIQINDLLTKLKTAKQMSSL